MRTFIAVDCKKCSRKGFRQRNISYRNLALHNEMASTRNGIYEGKCKCIFSDF